MDDKWKLTPQQAVEIVTGDTGATDDEMEPLGIVDFDNSRSFLDLLFAYGQQEEEQGDDL
jgi:hypothetical protein